MFVTKKKFDKKMEELEDNLSKQLNKICGLVVEMETLLEYRDIINEYEGYTASITVFRRGWYMDIMIEADGDWRQLNSVSNIKAFLYDLENKE